MKKLASGHGEYTMIDEKADLRGMNLMHFDATFLSTLKPCGNFS